MRTFKIGDVIKAKNNRPDVEYLVLDVGSVYYVVGVYDNSGDAFTYIVYPLKISQTLEFKKIPAQKRVLEKLKR